MLFNATSPSQKRATLRESLKSGPILRFPGAFGPLMAMLIENLGFDGVYISGAVLSNDLGLPDIGLTTLPEVACRGHEIAAHGWAMEAMDAPDIDERALIERTHATLTRILGASPRGFRAPHGKLTEDRKSVV